MNRDTEFNPQWTSPPGTTIADLMAAQQLSRSDLAHRLAVTDTTVDRLLEGIEPITLRMARRLQDALGGSAAFWMTRDQQYRNDVARLRDEEIPWLSELPMVDMERFGWISAEPPEGFEVESLLRYFAVPSVSVWRARYGALLQAAAFRTSPSFGSRPGAVAAWLRQGERIADVMPCAPWNPTAFRQTLSELRTLTRVRHPNRFLPSLQAAAGACGVAVVVLPAPDRCRASGAARWLSDNKALVLLSARHLTDDHLWFTFFHECAHLLLHRDSQVFLDEDDDLTEAIEREASQFAADLLIPDHFRGALANVPLETFAVARLASEIGIAPGIVVAQLQRMGRLPKSHLNRLKRRFEWDQGKLVSRETT